MKGSKLKVKMTKVYFWIDPALKADITAFAHGMGISASDFYKMGAMMLKQMITRPPEISLQLFTRHFKDVENAIIKKKVREGLHDKWGGK